MACRRKTLAAGKTALTSEENVLNIEAEIVAKGLSVQPHGHLSFNEHY
jgi:hypothetical protein